MRPLPASPEGDQWGLFYPWWLWAGKSLDILIEPRESFLNQASAARSAIGRLHSDSLLSYCDRHEADGAMDLRMLVHLVWDLEKLREQDPQLFTSFRKKLASGLAKEASWLDGHSFELEMALLLRRQGYSFICPDPPDFSVQTEGGTVFLECTVPRPPDLGKRSVREQTQLAIKRKSDAYHEQSWIRGKSVLVLGATHLRRAEWGDVPDEVVSSELEHGIADALNKTSYDLIMAFWSSHTAVDGQDVRARSCVSGPVGISDPVLIAFRDQLVNGFTPRTEGLTFRLPRPPR